MWSWYCNKKEWTAVESGSGVGKVPSQDYKCVCVCVSCERMKYVINTRLCINQHFSAMNHNLFSLLPPSAIRNILLQQPQHSVELSLGLSFMRSHNQIKSIFSHTLWGMLVQSLLWYRGRYINGFFVYRHEFFSGIIKTCRCSDF